MKRKVLMIEFNATGRQWAVPDSMPIRAIKTAAAQEWGEGTYEVTHSVGRAWAVRKEHRPGAFRPVGVAVVTTKRQAL